MKRLLRWYRGAIESRLIERAPLAVMFGLGVALPISLLLCLALSSSAAYLPMKSSLKPAVSLMPGSERGEYLRTLSDIQNECFDSGGGRPCLSQSEGERTAPEEKLWAMVRGAGLSGCETTEMDAANALGMDYIDCLGPREPGLTVVLVWFLGGVVTFLLCWLLIPYASSHRELMPRFSTRLWVSPYALSLLFLLALPMWASFLVYLSRLLTPDVAASDVLHDGLLVLWGGCFVAASWWTADLAEKSPNRVHALGVFGVAIIGLAGAVLCTVAVTGIRRGAAIWWLVPEGIGLLSLVALAWKLWRHRLARKVLVLTYHFLGRFVMLTVPGVVVLVLIVVRWMWDVDVAWIEGWKGVAGSILVGLVWSRVVERALPR